MEKKEQEMLEKIRSASEELQVPETLEPGRVRELLEKHDREKQGGRGKKQEKARRFLRSVRGRQVTALAAGLALVCLAGAAYTLSDRDSGGAGEADSEAASGAAAPGRGQNSGKTEAGELRAADSYEEIYAYLEEYQEAQGTAETETSPGIWVGAAAGSARSESASSSDGSYSDTNIRQAGVDEGDVVKTDGRYIYTLTDEGEITIVDTENGLEEAGRISGDSQILEFYVEGERLMLLAGVVDKEGGYGDGTALVTYDISDKAEPRKLGEVTQSGSYQSSRMVGDHVYVFTTFYADMFAAQEARESYVPQAGGGLIPESSIYLPETDSPSQYLVMTSTDVKAPDRIADSKALFAGCGELYVSSENIYWYENTSEHNGFSWEYSTLIRKISYKEGKLEAVAKGSVPGAIDDSFSIDEYEGNLRVVTTDESANGLYILDPDLKEIGRLDNLAKGEQVYSARLMGDTGYFVTFRNTDPLFSADLSDPENPQILGELKIPGFSEYLHPYGEGRLLGIGMDADEETGATGGVKLSMFNVSDPSDVKEEHTLILENVYSADVFYDYRAALIDTDRNIIGFSAYKGAQEKYYVFSYDPDKGFTCLMEEQVNGSSQRAGRGLYIENVLYVVKGNIIESYEMENFQKIGDMIL